MKKTLVALAAVSAVSAFAQSSVEIYGTLDITNAKLSGNQWGLNNTTNVYPTSTSSSAALLSFARQGTGTNNMGFRGKEDLGGGMYAGFDLQTGGLDLSNGAPGLAFSREANLKLGDAAWGELKIGRSISTLCSIGCSFDYNYIGAGSAAALTGLSPAAMGGSSRRSDQIELTLPTMSGFTSRISYRQKGDQNADGTFGSNAGKAWSVATGADSNTAAGASATVGNYKNVLSAGFNYANGPLRVAFVMETASTDSLATRTAQWAGVEYDFGIVKANVQASTNPNKGGTAVSYADGSGTQDTTGKYALSAAAGNVTYGSGTIVGLVAPVGKFNFGAQLANNSEQGIKATELFLQYSLSKRTTLFAYNTKLSGTKATVYTSSTSSPSALGLTALQIDPSITAFGMRHTF
jgi:predicted porin